ncbi:MAG: glycosyltransferase family 39 protein [Thermoflexales bacterium]|nr:glycosyltransferase family 39 protein [Thermoflexales bacterium]
MLQASPGSRAASPTAPAGRRRDRILGTTRRALALLLVLVIAGLLRFYNLNWDEGLHLHPDERYVAYLATLIKPVRTTDAYFDSGNSPLNPFNTDWGSRYVYGTLPLFGPRYVAELLDRGCGPQAIPVLKAINVALLGPTGERCSTGTMTGFDGINLVGRAWSAVMDLLSIAMLYAIARRLFNWRIGILAASLSALAVLQIQQAHFFTVDATANFFVHLSLYFCVNMVLAARATSSSGRGVRFPHLAVNAILAGIAAGCGIASKISVWPLVPMIVLSIGLHLARDRRSVRRGLLASVSALLLAGLGTFLAFRVAQPYSFVGTSTAEFMSTLQACLIQSSTGSLIGRVCEAALGLPTALRALFVPSARWVENLGLASMFVNGTVDVPFGHQWANRAGITFPLTNLVFWGMGIPLGLSAIVGLFYGLRQILQGRRWWAYAIPVIWVGAYFLYQSTQFTKSMRYLLPIYPLACLLAAVALTRLPTVRRLNLRALAIAGVVGLTLVWSAAFMQIYGAPITRATASRWIYANVPTAVTLSYTEDGQRKTEQLPMQAFKTSFGLPQIFWITPPRSTLSGTRQDMRVTFNHVSGEALVAHRIVDNRDGGGEISLNVQTTLNRDNPSLALGDLTIQPGHEYYVEVYQLGGPGLSARASVVANEQWDDPLPQAVDNQYGFSTHYLKLSSSNDGQMQPYNEDVPPMPGQPGKLADLEAWLDEADYIVLSSNRIYASVARLPLRFPLTTEYYRALFAGDLGFELAADISSFPRLGDWAFNSQEMPQPLTRAATTAGAAQRFVPYPTAEEAFSVYDHPRVLIFRKTGRYSRALVDTALGAIDVTDTVVQSPLMAVNSPHGMQMDDTTAAAQAAGGTWAALFPPDSPLNQSQTLALLAWLIAIELAGLAAFPLLAAAFRRPDGSPALADGGYAFAKIFGLLLVAIVVWWTGSIKLLPVTGELIRAAFAGLLVAGALTAWRTRRALRALVRERRPALIVAELVFLFGFLAFALIRAGNPDLWHPSFGGEKPMDLAFLNATLKSTSFPPYDPWYAGGTLNYYYFGFVLIGLPLKALGISTDVGYNLAIAALYGMTAMAAYGAALSLSAGLRAPTRDGLPRGAILAGVFASVLVVGLGNLDALSVLFGNWTNMGGPPETPALQRLVNGFGTWLTQGPANFGWQHYWNPTRLTARAEYPVDALPIAEFPLFTFLYGDLHAHMMAMPLMLSAIGLAAGLARGARRAGAITLAALLVGALWPTNTWDYPLGAVLCVAALGVARLAEANAGERRMALLRAIPTIIAFAVLSRAFFIPYLEAYGSAYNSIEPWLGERTPLWPYLMVYGLFATPLLFVGLVGIVRRWAGASRWLRAFWLGLGAGASLSACLLALAGVEVALLALPLIALAVARMLADDEPVLARGTWALVAGAFALTLFVEFFALRGDIGRMNTVFKFYIQAWLVLGVATATLVADALATAPAPRPRRAAPWRTAAAMVCAFAIFLAALYPAFAIPAKIGDRFNAQAPAGLDGAAYMQTAIRADGPNFDRVFPLNDDYEAIQWMRSHVVGSPVILEGNTGPFLYRWGSRFSVYTGLPTVLGWEWHERQQRGALPDRLVFDRERDITEFYETVELGRALVVLRRYNIKFVILGELERAYYGAPGLDKIGRMAEAGYLRLVHANERTRIYAVVE